MSTRAAERAEKEALLVEWVSARNLSPGEQATHRYEAVHARKSGRLTGIRIRRRIKPSAERRTGV